MTALTKTVYSEYEVRQLGIIFDDGDTGLIDCLSKLEQESTTRTVQKKCRGVVAKTRTRGTGDGTLTVTAHVPREIYQKMYAFESEGLVAGVKAYGRNSLHPTFTLTAHVYDEDDVEMLKAWPRCTVSGGPSGEIENGADEVAEVELEIAYSPDSTGRGVYEALVDEIESSETVTKWMSEWSQDLVTANSADEGE